MSMSYHIMEFCHDMLYFMTTATSLLPTTPAMTLQPYRSTCGIGNATKELTKMAGNSGSFPLNSWSIDRL